MTPPPVEGLVPLLQVFDMPRALAFYRDLLGFRIIEQSPGGDTCDWAWLRRGSAQLMLNTMYEADERPANPDFTRSAAHQDTGLFIGTPDVDAMFAYLRAKGLNVAPPVVQDYGMKQLYVADPDGYALCFQAPMR